MNFSINLSRTSAYLILSLFLFSCLSKGEKSTVEVQKSPMPTTYKIPEIPAVLNTAELAADYILEHYWDNFNFNDTALINKPEYSEQAFADFINILPGVSLDKAESGLDFLLKKAETNKRMYRYFLLLGEKYLFDPNAPTRNETLYELFVKTALSTNLLDDTYRIRLQKRFDLMQLNKIGQKATDFIYTLKNGSNFRLYSINSNLILLYFHNPGCEECKNVKERILASAAIQELTDRDALKILAIYPDQDLSEWEKYYAEIPENWINAYNKGALIKNKELYDLKAIPTLYLLDKDKKVLLKDARFEEIEKYILNN